MRKRALRQRRLGSSPHTRGAHSSRHGGADKSRLIPAYAGSTPYHHLTVPYSPAHPRIRGEHPAYQWVRFPSDGSSPHTRGAHGQRLTRKDWHRLIPAYAGSTRTSPVSAPASTAHPRIRGEHSADEDVGHACSGSSPHTRGAPLANGASQPAGRLIPAYAGSTLKATSKPSTNPAHPRIRGEHVNAIPDSHYSDGSSPHTRGAHHSVNPLHQLTRLIPAYAGSTRLMRYGQR